jgi:hypothetical protein
MKIQDLENKLTVIKEYLDANNPYKVGDIVTDHIGSIRITEIRYSHNPLSCVYYGIVLKADRTTSTKKGDYRLCYQTNAL